MALVDVWGPCALVMQYADRTPIVNDVLPATVCTYNDSMWTVERFETTEAAYEAHPELRPVPEGEPE